MAFGKGVQGREQLHGAMPCRAVASAMLICSSCTSCTSQRWGSSIGCCNETGHCSCKEHEREPGHGQEHKHLDGNGIARRQGHVHEHEHEHGHGPEQVHDPLHGRGTFLNQSERNGVAGRLDFTGDGACQRDKLACLCRGQGTVKYGWEEGFS